MARLSVKSIVGASAVNGISFIFSSAIVLVWSVLVTRSYTGVDSGNLLLAISVAGLINLFELGVSLGLIPLLSNRDGKSEAYPPGQLYFSACFFSVLIELIVAIIVKLISIDFGGIHWEWNIFLCIGIYAASNQISIITIGFFKGLLNFRTANSISALFAFFVYAPAIFCIIFGKNIWTVFFVMTATQFFCAFVFLAFTLFRIHKNKLSSKANYLPSWGAYYYLVKKSISIFPQMFAGIFFNHVQRFLIAGFSGLGSVALISLAYSITTRLHSILNAFMEIIFPIARQLNDKGGAKKLCLTVGGVAVFVYWILMCGILLVSHFFMPQITYPVLIFAIGVTFAVFAAPMFHMLNGVGASFVVSMCSLMSPVVFYLSATALNKLNFAVGFSLLPWAYVITMAVMLLQIIYVINRQFR